jgi:hypothetical protein
LTGASCLILFYTIKEFHPTRKGRKWLEVGRSYETVPFYVEDGSGKVLADPSQAEFHSAGKIEFSTQKGWKPSRRQRELLQKLDLSPHDLESRVRRLYAQHRSESLNLLPPIHGTVSRAVAFAQEKIAGTEAGERHGKDLQAFQHHLAKQAETKRTEAAAWAVAESQSKVLRVSEEVLLPNDPVCVIGPAYEQPASQHAPRSILIHKVHPADPFIIGVGSPTEVHAMLRKKARNQTIIGMLFVMVGLGMIGSCFF